MKKLKLLVEKNRIFAKIARTIYRKTILPYLQKKRVKNFKLYGKAALLELKKAFDELGVEFWLEYGTLLGAYREGGFIAHDDDIDVGVFLNKHSSTLQATLEKHGFKLHREILVDDGLYAREETYRKYNIDIDIFYFKNSKDSQYFYVHDFKAEDGKSWAKSIQDNGGLVTRERKFTPFKLEKLHFLEEEFWVPTATKEHLASVYGEDFMTPNSSWNPYNKPKNIEVLHTKIAKVITHE